MISLAIDTCSWLDLISDKEINPLIKVLKFWKEENVIQIIVPEMVKEEWLEKKGKIRNQHFDSLKTKHKHYVEFSKKNNENLVFDTSLDVSFVDEQIKLIENII